MAVLLTPLKYLRLEDERGIRLVYRDLIVTAFLMAALASPFLVFDGSNYFHKDGFVDKVGTFASVLTGFYVAGLLAVATFASSLGDLDGKIEVGRIILPATTPDGKDRYLSRREYVCYMFGYLAFGSLALTVLSILMVAVSSGMTAPHDVHFFVSSYSVNIGREAPRIIGVMGFSLLLAHLINVTCYGLYYLTERIYAKKPITLEERTDDTEQID